LRTDPSQAGSPRSGFTLIELLVVIAIISLLLAILVPSLGAARNLARLVVCLTQTRSQGTAWMMYLEDSNGNFPPWEANGQWFYGGKEPCVYTANVIHYRPLNPYVGRALRKESSGEIFRCPCDRPVDGLTHGFTTYDYLGNSYMMNWMFLGQINMDLWISSRCRNGQFLIRDVKPPETKYYVVNMKDVKSPLSKTVMLGDCQMYYVGTAIDAAFHTGNRMNVLLADGHANTVQNDPANDTSFDYIYDIYWITAGQ
jgi:prepilin-type N-terminal cleavage/methylation domain-containing protein/prepilin-type processing-associated H-X9-DG protein